MLVTIYIYFEENPGTAPASDSEELLPEKVSGIGSDGQATTRGACASTVTWKNCHVRLKVMMFRWCLLGKKIEVLKF